MEYWAIGGLVLVTVIIFALSSLWTGKKQQALNRAWAETALDLNWKMTSAENSSRPSMEGTCGDYFINARTEEALMESSYDTTVLTLTCHKPLQGALIVAGRNYSPTVNRLQGIKEIAVSDRAFSNNYVISGSLDTEKLDMIVTGEIKTQLENARSAADKMLTGGGIGEIKAQGETITYSIPGHVADKNLLKSRIEVLVALARNCEQFL